jgi:hypothetical protein
MPESRSGSPLRSAVPFPIADQVVSECLLDSDEAFRQAWRDSLASLPRRGRRGALLGAIGHIAESVVETIMVEVGYSPVWHFTGPGRHGVDLLMLAPTLDHLAAVEVKGTLRPMHLPRLTTGQFSIAWLNKLDNPGMREWGLHAEQIYGVVAAVNFADMQVRFAATADFRQLHPVTELAGLADLHWVDSG